jgi:exodeoxyribonuclease VII large subunit
VRQSQRGHLYFELIEKGAEDQIVGKLEAVIWRRDYLALAKDLAESGQEIADGHQIRCWCDLDFYPPFGRVQLVVRRVDPLFTLGLLERRRRETLEFLTKAGLHTLNKERSLSPVPLRLALVTSRDSAAYHDFLSSIRESGFLFQVFFIHAAVQGLEAESEVAAALAELPRLVVDCAVVIRGGGSRTDLAAFDSRRIAEAIAVAPVPVITGLGHEIDQSIADQVAHTATKTPTKAAEFLVQRVEAAERALAELSVALRRTAGEPVRQARALMSAAERRISVARFRVAAERRRVESVAERLALGARVRLATERKDLERIRRRFVIVPPRLVTEMGRRPSRAAVRIVRASQGRIREVEKQMTGWARLLAGLAPERTLARGFSITRGEAGSLVRRASEVSSGERITSQLVSGVVLSRVETGE